MRSPKAVKLRGRPKQQIINKYDMSNDTQLTPRQKGKLFLQSDELKDQVMQALPRGVKVEKFMRCLFTQAYQNSDIMLCHQTSLQVAIIKCAQFGIEPDGYRAHLIPFNNKNLNRKECQLIIDYKGLNELVMRSGVVSYTHSDIICENDEFEYNKGQLTTHKINFKEPRGEVYAAYSLARFKDGSERCAVMSLDELNAVRQESKARNAAAWTKHTNEMYKKTSFRRMCKMLTLSPEDHERLSIDDDQFDEEPAKLQDIERPDFLDVEATKVEEEPEPEPEPEPKKKTAAKKKAATKKKKLEDYPPGSAVPAEAVEKDPEPEPEPTEDIEPDTGQDDDGGAEPPPDEEPAPTEGAEEIPADVPADDVVVRVFQMAKIYGINQEQVITFFGQRGIDKNDVDDWKKIEEYWNDIKDDMKAM